MTDYKVDFYFSSKPMLQLLYIPSHNNFRYSYVLSIAWFRCEISKYYWRYF